MRLFKASFCLAVFAVAMSAQDDAAFQKWMKTVGGQMGALRKMEMKTGPEAVAAAEKLSASFASVGTYFTGKADDAAKMAAEAKAASDDLMAAAKAGDNDKAGAAFKTIGGSCKGCHDAHREKVGENMYKIK